MRDNVVYGCLGFGVLRCVGGNWDVDMGKRSSDLGGGEILEGVLEGYWVFF